MFNNSLILYKHSIRILLVIKNVSYLIFLTLLLAISTPIFVIGQDGPIVNDPSLKAEVVYEGLDFPTSMAFLEVDDILVLEKEKGTVNRIVNGQNSEVPLLNVSVASNGERGMLGIAVSSDNNDGMNKSQYVFLYYTESAINNEGDGTKKEEEPLGNRIYRYILDDDRLKEDVLLLDLPAASSSNVTPFHNGGRIVVGPDRNIYAVIGDLNSRRTQAQNIQDGPEPDGTSTIYRIDQDGAPVGGNPFEDVENLDKSFAYGIRNSFGMDFDPVTGNLWNTENGPDYGDEINLVESGFNSGALYVFGMSSRKENFDPEKLVNFEGKGKYSDPEFSWEIPVGVTALQFLDSDKYGEEYQNDMFVGDVNNGNIYRFELNEDRDELSLTDDLEDKIADAPEEMGDVIFAKGFGGITDIEIGPDGYLYILAINRFQEDNEGTIYRIVPV
jgi:aldose sugar dehydrogenase